MESFIYIFVLLNLLTVYGAGGAAPTAQSRTEAKRLNVSFTVRVSLRSCIS